MSGYSSCTFWTERLSYAYAPTSSPSSSASCYPLGHVSLGFRSSRSRGIVKFRASVRTGEREGAADDGRLDMDEVVSGVGVKGLEETRRGLSLEDGNGVDGELGFDGKWPPWKDLPSRYKLIGATSLAFVICNMDKMECRLSLEGGNGVDGELGFDGKWLPWKDLPSRYKLIGATSLAFVICNMDKVNLSIAIIPMSHQFGWNSSVAGLVQSSFFWGYALSQLPGGWLAKIFGGRKVLEIGVLAWSLSTALVPVLAGFMPGLVFSRILVGIGEGVSPSAATDLIARSTPLEERSRAVAFVFGGLSVGSVTGLLLAPPLIQNLGWESVFYIFGFLGVAWFLGFQLTKDEGDNILSEYFGSEKVSTNGSSKSISTDLSGTLKDVPWKSFFRTPAVWAMIYAHFCGSWGHYSCLSWLPTYFSEELNLNLTEAAWVSILPPMASVFVTNLAAQFADNLIANGVETTTVRKICQTVGFLSPAICMSLSSVDLGLAPWEMVGILSSGLALSSFTLSGLYCSHQDMSPEYASILLGITNTVGAVPGIVGVALTGYLLDSTHSWSVSLFFPSIFFYLTGTVVWLAFASSKPRDFSKVD